MCPTNCQTPAMHDAASECPIPVEELPQSARSAAGSSKQNFFTMLTAVVALVIALELAALVAIEASNNNDGNAGGSTVIINTGEAKEDTPVIEDTTTIPTEDISTELAFPSVSQGSNVCAGQNPLSPNVACIVDAAENVGPQAGANVTKGYKGKMEVEHEPILTPYWQNAMCPVNVHWHLGTEHYSVGQFDEFGIGPHTNKDTRQRALAAEGEDVQAGFRCRHYDANDAKFTKPYDWKHCQFMEVGETYEVHWPHSAAGACGTPNQYQTPFYDGVFCRDGVLTDSARQVGVQAQVFVVVNDDTYYYPDLLRGMIVDEQVGMGTDLHKYTGSTTGPSRNNEICSPYTPITWQVDRQCHLMSASAFDKLCYDMKQQRDDMSGDLFPHGSRELVADNLAANNGVRHLRASA